MVSMCFCVICCVFLFKNPLFVEGAVVKSTVYLRAAHFDFRHIKRYSEWFIKRSPWSKNQQITVADLETCSFTFFDWQCRCLMNLVVSVTVFLGLTLGLAVLVSLVIV